MKEFFSDDIGIQFVELGLLHIALLLLIMLGSILIYIYRVPLRNYKYEKRVRYSMATFALLFEFGLYAWKIGNGIWTWEDGLPIGVCGIALFLAIIAMYSKKLVIFEIGFFWSFGGVVSVMFPDIGFSVDRFRFYQYMFGHMFFFFMYIYMLFVLEFIPNFESFKKSYIAMVISAIVLIIVNLILDTNFFFLAESDGTPFELFEGNGWALYLIGVYIAVSLLMSIWYLPFYFYHKKNKVKKTIS